ncbi:N-acetylmuramoyl-L-alanine amidase [anaerobic digester metagenome]|uniref:N-acetylmuramoyl-L-alanine amidase n=1 Tax=anaerobic digester metagenome TaxID=1263854 RepID=A0A485LWV6_9ZZZZ
MAKICLDYGHGGKDPGAVYKGRKESDDNLSFGKAVAAELKRHGVEVIETRAVDETVSLGERSGVANSGGCDYFISFHRNAFKPEQAKGAETFVYMTPSTKSLQLAERIQKALAGVGFVNRGVKKANFHVLREIKSPAVLAEVGFLDNTGDNQLFDSKRNEIIKAIVTAVLSQLGVDYKGSPSGTKTVPKGGQPLYRVMAGSYAIRQNAERQMERLKAAGFDAVIMLYEKP